MKNVELLLKELNPKFETLVSKINTEIKEINASAKGKGQKLFSHKDTMLITYADQFQKEGQNDFLSLKEFLENDLDNSVSIVHLLPFYPWTSDDGFSAKNFHEVKKEYGTWGDLEKINQVKMFDCVFNHMSSQGEFFQKALSGDKKYQDMFHIYSKDEYEDQEFQENIKKVVRPRTHPLFHSYDFNGEEKYAWTTFSKDQVDTNLNDINMIEYLLECFFLYIKKGARYFRVDAVPFMWKELGTNCSHLPKTHSFVKLLRSICDEINEDLYIVTESNVPHSENITYWGNGHDEAHIIYNFSLAPLVLHALKFKTNSYIKTWAKEVFSNHKSTTFLNFTATHDGIGMRGLEGIVPESDVESLCDMALAKGGKVGKKKSRDGTVRPYELNITWASMMKDDSLSDDQNLKKLVNSHAIVMFFPGIGAHYAHNFLGSLNWQEGYENSDIPRRLNRKKTKYPIQNTLYTEKLVELIKLKNSCEAFSPEADFEILDESQSVLSFKRFTQTQTATVRFNLTEKPVTLSDGSKLESFELSINF